MSFTVIPAIDLLGGKVVRLHRGDYDEVTVYSESPAHLAAQWAQTGIRRLHVVDLDGARVGRPCHAQLVSELSSIPGLEVEVGGGIRSRDTLSEYLDGCKAGWAILGTVAYKNPTFVREACREWPGRIIVGLDARQGRVAVNGWLEDTDMTAVELGKSFADAGVAGVIYTDIYRDGTGLGPNVAATVELARETGLLVYASGGVSTLEHIAALRAHEGDGVRGVVVGRAILSGAISVGDAVRAQ